jgi:hypothetical protein
VGAHRRKVLNKELSVVPHSLAIQRVQDSMAGAIRSSSAARSLPTLTKVLALSAEWTLVNLSLLRNTAHGRVK